MRSLATLLLWLAPFALVALRRAIPPFFGLETHAPDPVIVGVAFAALRFSPLEASLFSAAAGLLADVPSGTPFGLAAARLALVASVLASVRRQVDTRSPFVPSILVFTASLVDRALAAIVLDASGDVPLGGLLGRGFLDAAFTVVLVPILWPAAETLRAAARPRS
ncbi:MAG TPA: rod shape-determining protein MreD [Planctomycetota bacterium]|nr:rod shape-determining protein MreD [Planctomycetota bacterium]